METLYKFFITLISAICLLGCGTNATKQKELELKEREIAIREKELELKQLDISNDTNYITDTLLDSKQLITNENSTKAKTTVKCGEETIFVGILKFVQDNDVVFNSERKSYYLYFDNPINMIDNNKFGDCGTASKIKQTTVIANGSLDLKPFINKKVKINGSLGPSVTMHYNTETALSASGISHLKNIHSDDNKNENWEDFISKFREDIKKDNFTSIIKSTSNSFNGYTDIDGGISIKKWLNEIEYSKSRKKDILRAINGKLTKKGNSYYTGGGYAGDYIFVRENNKWRFKGYIIIAGE